MPIIQYKTIHHPAFATNDLDKTIRFWRDLLGLRMVLSTGKTGNKQYFFELNQETYIAFFEWPDVQKQDIKRPGEPINKKYCFDHIAIEMENYENLYQLQNLLIEAEQPVSDIIDHGFVHSIYSYDPNGIAIEFCHNKNEVNIRNNPKLLDENPSDIAQEGVEPQRHHWPDPEDIDEEEHIVIPGDGSDIDFT